MIKKLKAKFILIAMLSVTLVLAAIVGGINIANYVGINQKADAVLEVLVGGGGRFPSFVPGMSKETPFETRYFSVRLFEKGSVFICDVTQIAAVDGEGAVSLAKELMEKGRVSGRSGDYRFGSGEYDDGSRLYVFLDIGRDLETFRRFLTGSILISIAGLACVLVLVFVLSTFALRPIKESYDKQKRFITNAGHDLKTPLTVIKAETEMIELQSGESEWTSGIKKQVDRLSSLTDKLVLLSRMEEGGALEMQPFDLSEALEETAQSYALCARERGLNMSVDVKKGIVCRGDKQRLTQAFALLLDNAVKYASDGDISVSMTRNGKNAVIRFKNRAEGMKKGSHDELFERFYRNDSARSSSGGHGIGLSVVKATVEAHRGTAHAFSHEDGVVEFTLTL